MRHSHVGSEMPSVAGAVLKMAHGQDDPQKPDPKDDLDLVRKVVMPDHRK